MSQQLPIQLLNDLQTKGLRITNAADIHVSRKGGAGPSDHQAVVVDEQAVMVPIYTQSSLTTPYSLESEDDGTSTLLKNGIPLVDVSFANDPAFYNLATDSGIPYKQIATLHSKDVLATTVLQTCIRYDRRSQSCKFCSIGQSLDAGRTIAYKTPEMLAEVAKVAVELDGVKHMVMTTGTPASSDRGAKVLTESVAAVTAAVDLPIQVQCEPPDDYAWFQRMKDAGAVALGMHVEVITDSLRKQIMPGKATVPISEYLEAFKAAVAVFGRGQVSTYILAGLGDTEETILAFSKQLVDIGVYPFVVPFVPISGTALEDHPAPSSEFMAGILAPLAKMLVDDGMDANSAKAGCSRCGACSSLSSFEQSYRESNLRSQTGITDDKEAEHEQTLC